MEWTDYYLKIAESVRIKSKDKYTKIGAVIIGHNNQIVSTGYNSFPRGIDDSVDERQERPEKYFWMVHAELNAILNASLNGVSTNGCSMYMTCGVPCSDCAKAIINAGIRQIHCIRGGGSGENKWDDHSIRSLQMFDESGVKVNFYDKKND